MQSFVASTFAALGRVSDALRHFDKLREAAQLGRVEHAGLRAHPTLLVARRPWIRRTIAGGDRRSRGRPRRHRARSPFHRCAGLEDRPRLAARGLGCRARRGRRRQTIGRHVDRRAPLPAEHGDRDPNRAGRAARSARTRQPADSRRLGDDVGVGDGGCAVSLQGTTAGARTLLRAAAERPLDGAWLPHVLSRLVDLEHSSGDDAAAAEALAALERHVLDQ